MGLHHFRTSESDVENAANGLEEPLVLPGERTAAFLVQDLHHAEEAVVLRDDRGGQQRLRPEP